MRPGEIQRMSAGTGIRHSEVNPSDTEPVHLYQIWILPDEIGHEPTYEQTAFSVDQRAGRLCLMVASSDGGDGSVTIHQDASVYWSNPRPPSISSTCARTWGGPRMDAEVMRGKLRLNDQVLNAGDGAAVSEEAALDLIADEPAELLLFDLP